MRLKDQNRNQFQFFCLENMFPWTIELVRDLSERKRKSRLRKISSGFFHSVFMVDKSTHQAHIPLEEFYPSVFKFDFGHPDKYCGVQ